MAATPEQKRRQQAALRRAWQIIRAERPDLWADAYQRARAEVDAEREEAPRPPWRRGAGGGGPFRQGEAGP